MVSPIAWWKFDEAQSIQTLADSSGSGLTATRGMTTTVSSGDPTSMGTNGTRSVRALMFDGSAQCVLVSGNATMANMASFTYVAWVAPTGYGGNSGGRILSFETTAGNNNTFINLNGEFLEFSVFTTAGSAIKASGVSGSTGRGTSYFVAAKYDINEKTPRLYKNGLEVTYLSQQSTPTGPKFNDGTLVIGNRIARNRGWAGAIDEVMIFATALSDIQIYDLYSPKATVECSVVAVTASPAAPVAGENVVITAMVENTGTAPVYGGTCTFTINGTVAAIVPLPPITAVTGVLPVQMNWAAKSGTNSITATLAGVKGLVPDWG